MFRLVGFVSGCGPLRMAVNLAGLLFVPDSIEWLTVAVPVPHPIRHHFMRLSPDAGMVQALPTLLQMTIYRSSLSSRLAAGRFSVCSVTLPGNHHHSFQQHHAPKPAGR
jgi:hypothetical protein